MQITIRVKPILQYIFAKIYIQAFKSYTTIAILVQAMPIPTAWYLYIQTICLKRAKLMVEKIGWIYTL
jgi:hypothetical protein